MDRNKFNLWRSLQKLIIGAVVAAVLSAVMSVTAPEIVSPSCGENAMFAFLFIALSAGMYGIFAVLGLADTVQDKRIDEESSVIADSMHIDDRVRMAANAKRYEWLRDLSRVGDVEDTVFAGRGMLYFFGNDLDREIDDAMRLQELHS